MVAGDCVLQPPEIRHRVLESSPGLEVIEVGCPADHETIADWALSLPTGDIRPDRDFDGQRFVRHIAAGALYESWRVDGWEHRDAGIGAATAGLAGARVARPTAAAEGHWISHDTEFALLVVLSGGVTFETENGRVRLGDADSVAIPGATPYRLTAPTDDCEVLDVTLPAEFAVSHTG
jgi:mannose-6-phosphate isomerase-like protein (cupin superfamily)